GAPHGVRRDHAAGHLHRETPDGGGRGIAWRDPPAVAARLLGAEAELPRQDGCEWRDAAAELLHQGRRRRARCGPGPPGFEVQGSLLVTRPRLAAAGLALIALVLPTAAAASVQLRGVDASAYPTIRASVLSSAGASVAPTITENGQPVAGLEEQNLGRAKAIATLIARAQSMRGTPLNDAVAAARSFVAAKQSADELAVVAFGSKAQTLSPFSTVKLDADSALAHLKTDPARGTALYD